MDTGHDDAGDDQNDKEPWCPAKQGGSEPAEEELAAADEKVGTMLVDDPRRCALSFAAAKVFFCGTRHPSIDPSTSIRFSIYPSVYPSVYPSIYLPIYIYSINLSLSLSLAFRLCW